MENGSEKKKKEEWNFQGNEGLNGSSVSVRKVFNMLMESIEDKKHLVPLCRVDPTENPLFRTTPVAPDAVTTAVHSFNFNSYAPTVGLPQAKRAIADYLSADFPNKLSPENIFLTVGATQAIDIILPVLARPGANILLPRPGYPQYESRANCCRLEFRHFDLLPDRGWEVDLDSLEAQADHNTVAMVLISPSNPCGNVFTYQHLKMVAETARKLGIFVISDEVYAHIAFGNNPFVAMGVFSSIVPVITLGSISKRWFLPGWRLGWIAMCDPYGIFHKTGVVTNIKSYLEITTDPPTFMQAAIPEILERTKGDFYSEPLEIMREYTHIFYEGCKEIPCLTCPHKPEGAMSVMVKINFSQIEGIIDDMDFCIKLAKEESVLLLPEAEEDRENGGDLERVGQAVSDLIMWKFVAKSTLWFGFGSLCLLSSCFSHGLNFSIFSAISQLAIVFLGVSFVSNTICQRNQVENKREFKLKEDDILRLAKLILPALNLAISKTRQLFSGEPSMTLKVAPFLLLGAEYGHFITIWRLCAIGFFLSFTAPKLYSCYTAQINRRAECLTLRLLDTWYACTHKKKLVTSSLLAFWNLSSVKTRIYTAFILLVLFRYLKQHVVQQLEEGEAQTQVATKEQRQASIVAGPEEKEPQQASMVAGIDEKEPQQALVVREQEQGCHETR